jgi:hypothetical protein
MKKATGSRLSLLAGIILIFTAISQVLLATDRITIGIAASGVVGVALFAVLVSIVRGLVAEVEFYEAHDRAAASRARRSSGQRERRAGDVLQTPAYATRRG